MIGTDYAPANGETTMTALIAGLFLFLGIHSLNMLAPTLRIRIVDRFGLIGWKAVFAVISLVGLVLLVTNSLA